MHEDNHEGARLCPRCLKNNILVGDSACPRCLGVVLLRDATLDEIELEIRRRGKGEMLRPLYERA